MYKKLKVAVVMGGRSSEREVSLLTGKEMVLHLNKEKYEIIEVDFPKNLEKIDSCDVALLALHGKGGEDGQIQGYLETKNIKYTGSGVLASAIGMDKMIFRWVMERFKLPMAQLTNKIPCVVKPVNGGSSIGVTIVKQKKDLSKAILNAKKYSDEVLIEEYLEGIELSCGVLGNPSVGSGQVTVLPVIEIRSKNDFFDYEAKYSSGKSEEICPAKINKRLTLEVQELARQVYLAVKARGYARIDFIIYKNKPYILEINTLPGMTFNSLIPKEAAVIGMSYSQLLDKIIELALE
jgi:D-alanine-D-alanine ligase